MRSLKLEAAVRRTTNATTSATVIRISDGAPSRIETITLLTTMLTSPANGAGVNRNYAQNCDILSEQLENNQPKVESKHSVGLWIPCACFAVPFGAYTTMPGSLHPGIVSITLRRATEVAKKMTVRR